MDEREQWRQVGRQLGEARRRLRLSKRAAAAKAGFSEAQWRVLEAGERTVAKDVVVAVSPRDDTLEAAARAVGLDPAEIFAIAGRPYNGERPDAKSEQAPVHARIDEMDLRLTRVEMSVDELLARVPPPDEPAP